MTRDRAPLTVRFGESALVCLAGRTAKRLEALVRDLRTPRSVIATSGAQPSIAPSPGHAIGIVCGYGALWLFGLQHAPPAMATGVSAARIGAAALSLASTGALMILLKAAHPPAGATTLIISLGIVTKPFYLLVIEIAVAILTLQAIVINRLAGIDYAGRDRHDRAV